MSRYFPHTPYAEEQPLAHTILTTHVLTRALTTGSLIGIAITTTRQLIPSLRAAACSPSFTARLLRSSATSSVWAMAITGVGLGARMYGREHIEWQDRSWRLLESKGQVETDDWTYVGAGSAAVAAVASRQTAGLAWRGVVGAAGLGSVAGMVGYMAWRYGVNGGKFPEKKLSA